MADMKASLMLCIEKLSDINRKLIEYRYGENKSYDEISRLLNRSREGTKVVLHRIRTSLGACVKKQMYARDGMAEQPETAEWRQDGEV